MKIRIPECWEGYLANSQQAFEIIPAQLYSSENYIPSVTTRLEFFTKLGPPSQTNMQIQGMLPNPCAFLIEHIRIYGINSKLAHGAGRLQISNKHYGFNPAWTYGLKEKGLQLRPALMIGPLVYFHFEILWEPVVFPWRGFENSRVYVQPIQVVLTGQMARSVA